jgi:hypothetical protein
MKGSPGINSCPNHLSDKKTKDNSLFLEVFYGCPEFILVGSIMPVSSPARLFCWMKSARKPLPQR